MKAVPSSVGISYLTRIIATCDTVTMLLLIIIDIFSIFNFFAVSTVDDTMPTSNKFITYQMDIVNKREMK